MGPAGSCPRGGPLDRSEHKGHRRRCGPSERIGCERRSTALRGPRGRTALSSPGIPGLLSWSLFQGFSINPRSSLITVAPRGHGHSPEVGGKACIPAPTPPLHPVSQLHLNSICRGDSPVLLGFYLFWMLVTWLLLFCQNSPNCQYIYNI